MTGHDVGQSSYRYWIIAGGSHSSRTSFIEGVEHQQVRSALQIKLIKQLGKRTVVGVGIFDIAILFKALNRCLVAARDTQHSIGKHPLAVDNVAEQFLDRPLAFGVGERAFFFCPRDDPGDAQRRDREVLWRGYFTQEEAAG